MKEKLEKFNVKSDDDINTIKELLKNLSASKKGETVTVVSVTAKVAADGAPSSEKEKKTPADDEGKKKD